MVDPGTYRRLYRTRFDEEEDDEDLHGQHDRLPKSIATDAPEPDDKLVLQLMPPFIQGFYLTEKKWSKSPHSCTYPASVLTRQST